MSWSRIPEPSTPGVGIFQKSKSQVSCCHLYGPTRADCKVLLLQNVCVSMCICIYGMYLRYICIHSHDHDLIHMQTYIVIRHSVYNMKNIHKHTVCNIFTIIYSTWIYSQTRTRPIHLCWASGSASPLPVGHPPQPGDACHVQKVRDSKFELVGESFVSTQVLWKVITGNWLFNRDLFLLVY